MVTSRIFTGFRSRVKANFQAGSEKNKNILNPHHGQLTGENLFMCDLEHEFDPDPASEPDPDRIHIQDTKCNNG
jgi:hypothetical protein